MAVCGRKKRLVIQVESASLSVDHQELATSGDGRFEQIHAMLSRIEKSVQVMASELSQLCRHLDSMAVKSEVEEQQ